MAPSWKSRSRAEKKTPVSSSSQKVLFTGVIVCQSAKIPRFSIFNPWFQARFGGRQQFLVDQFRLRHF